LLGLKEDSEITVKTFDRFHFIYRLRLSY